MKISVMGAGAVGSYYGGLLARAGQDVTLIARGPHLHAIREKGLKINSFLATLKLVLFRPLTTQQKLVL